MSPIAQIFAGLAAVVGAVVVIVATRPSAYHVERAIDVAAPADAVFRVLNDLHRFLGAFVVFGEPLAAATTFAGPAAGVGQSVSWGGDNEGSLAIVESVAAQRVAMTLAFLKPMKSTATYALTLTTTSKGTHVSWSMDGAHNFVGKAMGLFVNMDDLLGKDLEKGLARLQHVVEGKPSSP